MDFDSQQDGVSPVNAVDDSNASIGDTTAAEPVSPQITRKKLRKLLKDGEHDLSREIGKYRAALKKARHDLGYHSTLEDREKVKKAEWMYASIQHYIRMTDKNNDEVQARSPDANFHASVPQSIGDLKAARKRLKVLRSSKADRETQP